MDLAAVLALEILNGIASLVLISVGLAIIFGMMRVINLAHGEFLMLGGYAAIVATNHGVNIWIAMLVVAPIVVGIIGVIAERAHHPLPLRPHDRHAAGHLGPEPVLRRARDDDLRQHGGRHRRAARQRRGRALQHQPLSPGPRRRSRPRCWSSIYVRAAHDAARPDRARHDGEPRHGGRARREPAARVRGDLRRRRRPHRPGRRPAGADLRRAAHGGRGLRGQGVHHRHQRRHRHHRRDRVRGRRSSAP